VRKSGSFAPALKSEGGSPQKAGSTGHCTPLGFGFLLKCRGVGRAVFVLGRLFLFARFVGRNNPFKSAIFGHGAEQEVRIAGEDRESGAEKITRGGGIGLLRFAALNQLHHLVDVGIRGAQAGDGRRILLDQAEQREVLKIGRDTDFNNSFGLMLFRRIKLREPRPENVGLPILSAGGRGILFDLIIDEPDFRPVIFWSVADKDDLEKGFIGFEIDRMMELRSEGTQFFQKGNADLLEVLLRPAGGSESRVDGGKVGEVAIEANGPRLRGDLPLRSAKENSDVTRIDGRDAWRNGFRFKGMIDGREENGVIGDLDDGAAAGQIGDDFVLLRAGRDTRQECDEQEKGGANEELVHKNRVAQRAGYRPRTT